MATAPKIQPVRIELGTKAETLERLAPVLQCAKVLPQITPTLGEWNQSADKVLAKIQKAGWLTSPLVVRSSCREEDTDQASQAGRFTSVLGVVGEEAIRKAVAEVIASYPRPTDDQQILIQPMLDEVRLSGVAFTCDPSSASPYWVFNYDGSGSTSSVTSGEDAELKTVYHLPGSATELPADIQGLEGLLNELTALTGRHALDIEFGIDAKGEITLFQCRPLNVKTQPDLPESEFYHAVGRIHERIEELNRPHPYLLGSRTVFGVMPDWNPAEIIGIRPRPLALSMYKELVTDSTWAYQRDNYGYRKLRSFPLLVDFYGLPYIDVRVSFNSFIPKSLDDAIGDKLVNFYIDRLIHQPMWHDKVEFEVLYTCFTFDLDERLKVLEKEGFSPGECETISQSLKELTNFIIHPERGPWKKDLEKIAILEERLERVKGSELDNLHKLYWILEDCKRYGVLPFAGLARAGFIAVQMLQSLVTTQILSPKDCQRFMASLKTIGSKIHRDFQTLSRAEFLKRNGHLRPGTYDILSPRYDETPNEYFDWNHASHPGDAHEPEDFSLTIKQFQAIENLLKASKIDCGVLDLFSFIRTAIEGREMAKFVFTRSLSDGLSLFKEIASENGFSPDDASYANIRFIYDCFSSCGDTGPALARVIEEGRQKYRFTRQLRLPPLLTEGSQAWSFTLPPSEPNYITHKRVTARVADLNQSTEDLTGKIAFIENADPGFDWIFSRGIAGFVTMYGGVNSHMAIRAAELEIPAVIGAGESHYKRWLAADTLELDCENRWVKIVK